MSAKDRGWGSGWPNCQAKMMSWAEAGGIRLFVRREIIPLVEGFVNEIAERGYPVDIRADDWGYCCRAIRGTKIPSNHSWGLAIDVNATTNPMASKLITDMPRWVIEASARWGFYWGGNYLRRPDAMHFEFLGRPEDVEKIYMASIAALKPTEVIYTRDYWQEMTEEMTPDTVTSACAVPEGGGTWRVTAKGDVIPFQDAPELGDLVSMGVTPNAPITDILAYSRQGAWLIGADGGIFALGDAPAIADVYLNVIGPIVSGYRDDDGALVLIGAEGHAYNYPVG